VKCKTKPISGGKQLRVGCTNKPNPGQPGRCPQANSAKQTQFRRSVGGAEERNASNKPNFAGRARRPAASGPARAGCTNKPNSAESRRGSPYKQTQFAPAGQAGGAVAGPNRAKQTQFRRSAVALVVEICKTNPIPAVAAIDSPHHCNTPSFHHSNPKAIMPNKAKPGHPGVSGEPDTGRRADAPNKPH
jgi:hypothetical protein